MQRKYTLVLSFSVTSDCFSSTGVFLCQQGCLLTEYVLFNIIKIFWRVATVHGHGHALFLDLFLQSIYPGFVILKRTFSLKNQTENFIIYKQRVIKFE